MQYQILTFHNQNNTVTFDNPYTTTTLEHHVYKHSIKNKTIYYFDDNYTWCSKTYNDDNDIIHIIKTQLYETNITYCPSYVYIQYTPIYITLPIKINDIDINRRWMQTAIRLLNIGDTLDDFAKMYNDLVITNGDYDAFYKKYENNLYPITESVVFQYNTIKISDDTNRFILKINQPHIERHTDNKKKNTFDFIRLYMSIPTKTDRPDRLKFIQTHIKEITALALDKIQNNKRYQKFGIPIEFLKLSNATITAQSELSLLFELKIN